MNKFLKMTLALILISGPVFAGSGDLVKSVPSFPLADANVNDDLTIDGGTIDDTVIGGTTPAAGTFTTLTATDFFGDLTGVADTALALDSNPVDCSAGQSPEGIDQNGDVEGCTDYVQASEIDTSAEIATIVTNETGSGALVFANTPTFSGQVKISTTTTVDTTAFAIGIDTGSSTDLTLNVPTGGSFVFNANGSNQVSISGASVNVTNNDVRWSGGQAVTSTAYQIVRDADATNQLHLNVPTGAGFEFSVADIPKLIVTGTETYFQNFIRPNTQSFSVADDGAGTPALGTLTPSANNIQVTCNDVHNCNITMGETGMQNGYEITIVNMSANNAVFADTGGVSELAGGFTAGQYDTIKMQYQTDRWVELSRSNN